MSNSSIWLIDMTPSGATTPGQSKAGSNDKERVQCIPQSPSITEVSPSNYLIYTGHLLGESYPSTETQSVYFTTPADLTAKHRVVIIIIIMSCFEHGYPWPSLANSPYYSSPLAGLQGYIPYPHIAAVCMFELVILLLLGHMRGSIGVHPLWARSSFSSSVLHVWFV